MNYRAYEKPNETAPAKVARDCLMRLPNKDKLFYGNYGGLGSDGGMPIDRMDELFRRHDIVYTEAKTIKVIRVSDKELIKYLQEIPDNCLSINGQAYRDRAIKLFKTPVSKYLMKPCSTLFHFKEPAGSAFPNPEAVVLFFEPSNPGFPKN